MAGQKRKREDAPKTQEPDDAALQRKVTGKLHHSFKEAIQAAKKAKAFEVQRTVKKLKEARQKGTSDVPSLEAKLESAKALDHTAIARVSLARKIQKIKTLAIHPMIQGALAEVEVPSIDSISGEAKQAVLSSKILAGEVGRLCTALKELVEPPAELAPDTGSDEEESNESESGEEEEEEEEEEWKGITSDRDQENSDDSDDSEDAEPDPAVLNSALSKLGIPLDSVSLDVGAPEASSSSETDSIVLDEEEGDVDDQASWESGSIDSQGNVIRAASPTISSSSPPAKRTKGKNDSAGSRFLPSLASGFIRGDSDGSDIEDADAGPTKKNRRGQRARKAIWEKKYGKNANHVKKAREEATTRGRGRGRGGFARRGGHVRTDGQTTSRGGAPGIRGRGGRVRPPPAPLPTTQDAGWAQRALKKEKEEKPMHPSWIAKQKLKSRESITTAPRGKKIVFD